MIDAGVRRFRIEFLSEGRDEVRQTIDRYRKLLRKRMDREGY